MTMILQSINTYKLKNTFASCTSRLWRWGQYAPPKRRLLFTSPQGAASQATLIVLFNIQLIWEISFWYKAIQVQQQLNAVCEIEYTSSAYNGRLGKLINGKLPNNQSSLCTSNSNTVLSVLFISHYKIIKRKNYTAKVSIGKHVTSSTQVIIHHS
jgi:hypothetical protein